MGMSSADYFISAADALGEGMSRNAADQRAQEAHKLGMERQRFEMDRMKQTPVDPMSRPLSATQEEQMELEQRLQMGESPADIARDFKVRKMMRERGSPQEGIVPGNTFDRMRQGVGVRAPVTGHTQRDAAAVSEGLKNVTPIFQNNTKMAIADAKLQAANQRFAQTQEFKVWAEGKKDDRQMQELAARLRMAEQANDSRARDQILDAMVNMFEADTRAAAQIGSTPFTQNPGSKEAFEGAQKRAESGRTAIKQRMGQGGPPAQQQSQTVKVPVAPQVPPLRERPPPGQTSGGKPRVMPAGGQAPSSQKTPGGLPFVKKQYSASMNKTRFLDASGNVVEVADGRR